MALLSLGVLFAAPAHAADTQRSYYNAYIGTSRHLAQYSYSGNSEAYISSTYNQIWYVQQTTDSPSGHDRVFLKTASSGGRCLDDHAAASGGRCLDDHAAASGGRAWVISCNGGDYQLWEVFYQSNGSRVFKSWGAWTKQGRHLCLASTSGSYYAVMTTCNESAQRQQWYTS